MYRLLLNTCGAPRQTAGCAPREDAVIPHWESYTSYSLYFDGSDMTADDTEFVLAMAAYQKRFRRRYPTWREVLHVARCLGYRKAADSVPLCEPAPPRPELSEFELMKAKLTGEGSEPPAD